MALYEQLATPARSLGLSTWNIFSRIIFTRPYEICYWVRVLKTQICLLTVRHGLWLPERPTEKNRSKPFFAGNVKWTALHNTTAHNATLFFVIALSEQGGVQKQKDLFDWGWVCFASTLSMGKVPLWLLLCISAKPHCTSPGGLLISVKLLPEEYHSTQGNALKSE